MPLPQELEARIAAAGRAKVEDQRREDAERCDRQRESAALGERVDRAHADAFVNAEAAWAWVVGSEADEVRATMRRHGVDRLRLGTWSLLTSARCALGFGAVTVDLLGDDVALRIHVIRPGY